MPHLMRITSPVLNRQVSRPLRDDRGLQDENRAERRSENGSGEPRLSKNLVTLRVGSSCQELALRVLLSYIGDRVSDINRGPCR